MPEREVILRALEISLYASCRGEGQEGLETTFIQLPDYWYRRDLDWSGQSRSSEVLAPCLQIGVKNKQVILGELYFQGLILEADSYLRFTNI